MDSVLGRNAQTCCMQCTAEAHLVLYILLNTAQQSRTLVEHAADNNG